jgi:peptidoglycan/LPS O-acetylase OafA/YrhL
MRVAASRLLQLLTRQTSGGRFVPEVDGLRFIAIGAVLLFHFGHYASEKLGERAGADQEPIARWFAWLTEPGFVGVQIFFAISGLILGLPFARAALAGGQPVGIKAYFLRRVTRLEPPYIINLLLWTALIVVIADGSLADLLPHLIASIVYVHAFTFGEPSIINSAAWSLEIEVQFYLLAPILAVVYSIRSTVRRRAILVASICMAGAWQSWLDHPSASNPFLGLTLAHQLHWFLVGMLVADLKVARWETGGEPTRSDAFVADMLGIIGLGGLWWLLNQGPSAVPVAQLVGPFLVLLLLRAALRGSMVRWTLTRPPIYLIGGMCYTIYLYHPLIKSGFGKAILPYVATGSPTLDAVTIVLLLSGVTISICTVLFVLFERPFMRPLRRSATAT